MPQLSPSTFPRRDPAPISRAARVPGPTTHPDGIAVLAQLERILNSRSFAGAHRSQLFLRYIVEHALASPGDSLKEYSIALDVFGRDSYDPAVNNSVRVEAGRLRFRLLEYYAGEGHADPLLIEVPRGSYRVVIRPHQPVLVPAMRLPLASGPATSISAPTPRRRHPWAIPIAFILGAFLGYRASH